MMPLDVSNEGLVMQRARLLIVDDEVELERLIKQRLRRQILAGEFELLFAHSGKEALDLLTQDPDIDLILTDINMPEMDGLILLESLSAINSNLKAVVVSAYGNMKNIRAAMHRGALDFLVKPIDFEDFILTIQRALQFVQDLRQSQEQLQTLYLQLIQSEKMSALDNLVAGVAYEINNPVCCLSGNLQPAQESVTNLLRLIHLYQTKYPQPDPEIAAEIAAIDLADLQQDLPNLLSSMQIGIDRIRTISSSLRFLAWADSDRPVLCNLHEGIDSVLMILQHRLMANLNRPEIEVIKNYADLPLVECWAGQLNQVVMNVLANAIDALEKKSQGRSFDEIVADPNQITIQTAVSEDRQSVVIRIKDNGIGISDDVKQKIFNHRLTNKDVGQGTGLGLEIARSIVVHQHAGTLDVQSTLGQGSEFIMTLPISGCPIAVAS